MLTRMPKPALESKLAVACFSGNVQAEQEAGDDLLSIFR